MTRRFEGDKGMATVVVMTVIGLLAGAAALGLAIGIAVETRHRVQAAADAAALAAAGDAISGSAAACNRGADLARRNGAHLTSCLIHDAIADVRVEARPPGTLAIFGPVVARARAGPASAR